MSDTRDPLEAARARAAELAAAIDGHASAVRAVLNGQDATALGQSA